jgi:EmrB/QacA subfamily drug resistance transporter
MTSNGTASQGDQVTAFRRQSRAILIALLFPTMAIILNGSMFSVALPTIRDEFGMQADVAAWLTIAFSLPFMMLMPLYGRLGDELGKSRLLIAGLIVFCLGSLLAMTSKSLAMIFLARIIQGTGSAGITPMSLAIIAERFSAEERGRAMGTWNSVAPGTSIFAPTLGGFLVVAFGWRSIFVPVLAVGLVALWITRSQVPTLREKVNWGVLRIFDWIGAMLLSGTVIFLVFYLSSRPITGEEPLRDPRLLLGLILFGISFIAWERRHRRPLVDLALIKRRTFRLASVVAALRMCMMIGISFLIPLYLADIYDLVAAQIGLLITVHAIALFVSIRVGGTLADGWSNGRLVTLSLGMQTTTMIYFALLPAGVSFIWVVVGMAVHGLGAGLSLAALHRTALANIPVDQTGVAAGVYSMIRFAGVMIATVLAGVILQNRLDQDTAVLQAYQIVFAFLAALGVIGVLMATRLPD